MVFRHFSLSTNFIHYEAIKYSSAILMRSVGGRVFIFTYIKTLFMQVQTPRLEMPPEETTDLEELEQFAKMFKQKRIKLGMFH